MSSFTHTTVNGTRYGIDADGTVLAPDADGTPDQLVIGHVRRTLQNDWLATTPDALQQHRYTRESAIQYLIGFANLSRPTIPAHDPEAPPYTCFTLAQAVSEARSALAVCVLTADERDDCERTLDIAAAFNRARMAERGW